MIYLIAALAILAVGIFAGTRIERYTKGNPHQEELPVNVQENGVGTVHNDNDHPEKPVKPKTGKKSAKQ